MSRRRPRRRARGTGLQLGAALIVLIVAAAACLAAPELFLEPPAVTRTPAPAPEEASADWIRLYFTQPELTARLDDPTGGIPDQIAASIAEARATVDIAVYEFNLRPLAEAVLAAHARGVRVRVVTDTDSAGLESFQALQAAGIPLALDGRGGTMHHKFIVLDGAAVWTGSMNFTPSDAYRNNNNVLYLQSTRLAQNYTTEFEEMFVQGAFGPASTANTPHPVVTVDGARVENYFSPDDGAAARIRAALEAAQTSIHFMAFAFTRADFAETLLAKSAAGVEVRGVFETRQIAAGAEQAWRLLTEGGLADNVRQDGNRYNLHHKVFIVDRAVVVTGSYNFSNNAENNNDENVLILHQPDIAAAYFAEWERVWAEAGR